MALRRHEKKVAATWDSIWRDSNSNPQHWSSLSQLIWEVLTKELHKIDGNKLLEAGSGTGKMSLKIAQRGCEVFLIDTSPNALKLSKKLSFQSGVNAHFVAGSIFNLPFQTGAFHVVWNAGVLEHYSAFQQKVALKETRRVCHEDGLFVSLNPCRKALIYRMGKWLSRKMQRWRIGYEEPLNSLLNEVSNDWAKTKEYSVGFLEQFDHLAWIPLLGRMSMFVKRFFAKRFWKLNYLPGYLLVSIAFPSLSIKE